MLNENNLNIPIKTETYRVYERIRWTLCCLEDTNFIYTHIVWNKRMDWIYYATHNQRKLIVRDREILHNDKRMNSPGRHGNPNMYELPREIQKYGKKKWMKLKWELVTSTITIENFIIALKNW